MDAAPIQYARTDDGVNIAYWTLGEGPPLLYQGIAPGIYGWSFEREYPGHDPWIARLAEHWTLIQFDHRGCGLSDRDVEDRSFEALIMDVEAVTEASGFPQTALFSPYFSGSLGIVFAAKHPDRVTRLVLWCAFVSRAVYLESPRLAAVRGARPDWSIHAEGVGRVILGWSADNEARLVADRMRSEFQPDEWWSALDARVDDDATPYLSAVRAPTLVAFRTESLVGAEFSRPLAAGIPDARMVALPGEAIVPGFGDADAAFDAIYEFLTPNSDAVEREPPLGVASGFRTLLFTDLESSTALTQALGDAKAQEVLHGHNDAVRAALDNHGGEEVKHTGDGIFAAFGSAVSAVQASLQIQRELAGAEVRVRIGLNAGEPIAEDGDYFGSAVQLAARVCDRAEPGQVLVSNVVKELCSGKLFQFEDQGEATLKGFPEPVRLFVVGEAE